MKKLTGLDKIKTAIFISGSGSNLKNLIKFSYEKNSPISINLVISNKKNAKGLKYADQNNIQMMISDSEKKIINQLKKKNYFYLPCGFYENLIMQFY